ncbi:hypothetical protein ES703_18928 [subsurface metagenome]
MNGSKHNDIASQGKSQENPEPHPRDGHIRLPNEVVEKLAQLEANGSQYRIIFAVWRRTLGWQKSGEWRNEPHPISLGDLAKATGLDRRQVRREVKNLTERNILTRQPGQRKSLVSFNLDHTSWVGVKLPPPTEHGLGVKLPLGGGEATPSVGGEITPSLGVELPPPPDTKSKLGKKPKETINKHTKETYIFIFDFWDSLKIITHKKLMDQMRRALKSALQNYTQEEICQSMKNYVEILNSDDYFFSYRWTLEDFLRRGLEKFIDGEVARENYRIREERRDERPQKGVRPKPRQERLHPIKRIDGETGKES